MENLDQRKRIFTALIVIIRKKINIDIPNDIIKYFTALDYKIKDNNINSIKKYKVNINNYDNRILDLYNTNNKVLEKDINNILYDYLDLSTINVAEEYKQILDNDEINEFEKSILSNARKEIEEEEKSEGCIIS